MQKRPVWTCYILLILAVVLFYLPVLENNFITFDDPRTIYENPNIRSLSPQSILWMLTTQSQGFWVPLTWFSLALNYWMAGNSSITFHLTNLFFHALNTVLVFLVCLRVLGLARRIDGTGDEARFNTLGFQRPC